MRQLTPVHRNDTARGHLEAKLAMSLEQLDINVRARAFLPGEEEKVRKQIARLLSVLNDEPVSNFD